MLIISDFHDYYDSVSSLGIDKQCPYQRKEISFDHNLPREKRPHTGSVYYSKKHRFEVSYRLIGFCGNIYPFVIVQKSRYGVETSKIKDFFFYSESDLMDFLKNEAVKPKQSSWRWYTDYTLDSIKGMGYFFDRNTWKDLVGYFQKHKVPIFLLGSKHSILNPTLKKFGFQQVKDPFTAYQDVYMFISGVLGVETKPTVKISDKDMAESKGHGGKYSFRKTPGGKRGKPRWR